ncbi:MAG: glutaredoxin family protein [Candidatus Hodarchaeota archaeon]
MAENIEFTVEEGTNNSRDVTVYALSTCGFCKACLKFLHDNDVAFKYVYFDLLDENVKDQLKENLKETFNERVMFPFVIFDDKDVIVGFKRERMKEMLNIKEE